MAKKTKVVKEKSIEDRIWESANFVSPLSATPFYLN